MQYVVTAIKSVIPVGMTIELNERQAALRKRFLEPLKKKGLYRVIVQIEFKHGEVIGFPGDIKDKILMPTLSTIKESEKKDAANAGPNNSLPASNIQA